MIIGLTGKKCSGKDTVYSLIRELNPEAQRFAFADELKRQAIQAWNHVHPSFPLQDFEKEVQRPLFQIWGTEMCRRIHGEDYWLKFMPNPSVSECLVVTDVRYQNEANLVKSRGGVMVRVTRPEKGRLLSQYAEWLRRKEHSSESQRFPVDFTIRNSGSMEELRDKVKILWGLLT